jgi:hypothetical protein
MNEFLEALRADLLDRRMRAILVLVSAALIGGLAYAVLGGGSSAPSTTQTPATAGTPGAHGSITPTAAASKRNEALAETTSGEGTQRRASTRDPFSPLLGVRIKSPLTTSTPTSTGKSGGLSVGGSFPTSPTTPPARQRATTFGVSILLGEVPPGVSPLTAPLSSYSDLKFQQKLPSPKLRLLSFDGTSPEGKDAKFKIIGEVIPKNGPAICSPGPTQCQVISLESGQTEELEYLPPAGAAVVYELQVVTIEKH